MQEWREVVPEILHPLIDHDRRRLVEVITKRCPWLLPNKIKRGYVFINIANTNPVISQSQSSDYLCLYMKLRSLLIHVISCHFSIDKEPGLAILTFFVLKLTYAALLWRCTPQKLHFPKWKRH